MHFCKLQSTTSNWNDSNVPFVASHTTVSTESPFDAVLLYYRILSANGDLFIGHVQAHEILRRSNFFEKNIQYRRYITSEKALK